MKSVNKQLGKPAQAWVSRVERRYPPNVDYDSELRNWLQHVILEAEKDNNFKKRDHFLSLLKDLNTA
jgi:hypothetical protein